MAEGGATWIGELFDRTVGQLKFFEIVNWFEQGLYLVNGIPREIPLKGQPKCKKKDRKKSYILKPGLYAYPPIVGEIIKESTKIQVMDLGAVRIITAEPDPGDRKDIFLSCNIRVQVEDMYKAYTIVDDWGNDIKKQTLSFLAKEAIGSVYNDWIDKKFILKIQRAVLDKLRTMVGEDWGVIIHDVQITDINNCQTKSLMIENADDAKAAYFEE